MNALLKPVATTALLSPAALRSELPLDAALRARVAEHRRQVRAVLNGDDARLLVIVGPCSLHDPVAALHYADLLAELAPQVSDQLLLVMRAYVEKPRTTVGWKGLVYDPHLDGSADMAQGLRVSRELMLEMIKRDLPVASELLQPLVAPYLEDLLSWAAIGARTTESQIHREMVSGLRMPVGFKNGTDGSVGIACDAIRSAAAPHQHLAVDAYGQLAMVETLGNPDTHLVLRGGHQGPNYDAQAVAQACQRLAKQGIAPRVLVDCSHANSGKDPTKQPQVLAEVVHQRLAGQMSLRGVMLEGHLFTGAQALGANLQYGVSVTDACLGFAETKELLLKTASDLRQG